MTNEQINDWRYPPVPQAIAEALKNYPELIAHLEWALRDDDWRMSNSLTLSGRTSRLHSITEYLKDGLWNLANKAESKLEAAKASGDAVAIAAAQAEDNAITQAMRVGLWKALMPFYGIEDHPIEGLGMRVKEGA